MAKKEDKKETPKTVVSFIKARLYQGVKDRKELRELVWNDLAKAGVKHNSKGKLILKERVGHLANAMLRDIANSKPGWWSKVIITEDDTQLKMADKKAHGEA